MANRKTRRNVRRSNRSRKYRQRGGSIRDKALKVLEDNKIDVGAFMTELYVNKTEKTVDGIVFKVVKKADRYFDIFDLYLMAKSKGAFLSSWEEIMKVDFGSGSLS